MEMKFLCGSCGYEMLVNEKGLEKCPECGSDNVHYLKDWRESKSRSSTFLGLSERERRVNMIKIVVGLIGLILLIVGLTMIGSVTGVTLFIIGVILFVGALCGGWIISSIY